MSVISIGRTKLNVAKSIIMSNKKKGTVYNITGR